MAAQLRDAPPPIESMELKILLVLTLAVSLKEVKLQRDPFYKVDDGTGVWWERIEAVDGSFCRHRWQPDFNLKGKMVECAWTFTDEFAKPRMPAEDPQQPKRPK